MYEAFFHLKTKPFELVPNPQFLYLSRTHKKAMHYLQYGIRERAGFILLTGEVGSGKTTIITDLVKRLDRNVSLAKVFNTKVDSGQLLAMINDEFGLDVKGKDKVLLLAELYDYLIDQHGKGRHAVLIVDEAQNLKPDLLEELRLISNLETDTSKLLQIVLAGQPELRNNLALPELRQLRQRISINCRITPLTREETEEYVFHRLEVAGNRNAVTFSDESMDIMHACCKGIPRLVNIVSDFVMLTCYMEKTRAVDAAMVSDIIEDLDFESLYWGSGENGQKALVNHTALLDAFGIDDKRRSEQA